MMMAGGKKARVARALAGAPLRVRRLLRESELILGGLLKVTGEEGDVVVRAKGKAHNARWIGKRVRIKAVSEAELHGMTRAFGEISGRELGNVALLIPPKEPMRMPKKIKFRVAR